MAGAVTCSHHDRLLYWPRGVGLERRVVKHLLSAAIVAGLVAVPLPAAAQASLAAYDAVREGLAAVWDELPLTVRNATLVDAPPTGFGQYQRRAGRAIAPGETVMVYAELYGYGAGLPANGGFRRNLAADLTLLDAQGAVRANQIDFWQLSDRLETRPLELHLSFSATLSAFEPGDYVLRFTIRDGVDEESTSFDVPVTLTGEAGSETDADAASGAESGV